MWRVGGKKNQSKGGNPPGVNHRTGIRQKPLPPRYSLHALRSTCDAYQAAEKKIGKVLKDLGHEDVTFAEKTAAIALALPGEAGELPTRRDQLTALKMMVDHKIALAKMEADYDKYKGKVPIEGEDEKEKSKPKMFKLPAVKESNG